MKIFTRPLALAVLFLSVAATALRADDSLDHARQAQALLGPDVWSQVIRIENAARFNRYPRIVHALVFELAGVLWFYADVEGTQSFSLHRGLLAEEKADFAPLLRAIDRGFVGWTVVASGVQASASGAALRNGCFIESVVALRDRLRRGGETVRPQLLSYYADTSLGGQGHTVLAYETGGRVEVIDSAQADRRFNFPAAFARDALQLARAMAGNRVASARLLPVDWPAVRADYYSTVAAAGGAVANSG